MRPGNIELCFHPMWDQVCLRNIEYLIICMLYDLSTNVLQFRSPHPHDLTCSGWVFIKPLEINKILDL